MSRRSPWSLTPRPLALKRSRPEASRWISCLVVFCLLGPFRLLPPVGGATAFFSFMCLVSCFEDLDSPLFYLAVCCGLLKNRFPPPGTLSRILSAFEKTMFIFGYSTL
ncbi:hypothetical protein NPIL_241601 [Nephila pilipes]|uniref:Uncharacterized protein n=1 Tax=Nephila pilipes TaxID=299642 RepID=A0A8X6NPS6_NEPPI|nr:hypothetical protein NPIL_241601 [Nephila pilipes]